VKFGVVGQLLTHYRSSCPDSKRNFLSGEVAGHSVLYDLLPGLQACNRFVGRLPEDGDHSPECMAAAKCAQWHSWSLARFSVLIGRDRGNQFSCWNICAAGASFSRWAFYGNLESPGTAGFSTAFFFRSEVAEGCLSYLVFQNQRGTLFLYSR